jgi:hypothetical protein
MNKRVGKKHVAIGILAAGVIMLGLLSLSSTAHAQCTPLTSHVCRPETSYPHDYSFTSTNYYWGVVGVIPTSPDDKNIVVYPSCGSGTPLATSTGTNGIDFVVGDFNHTPLGTYYARATNGDPSAFYNVYWRNGGTIAPIGAIIDGQLGGSGAGCNMIQIYDLYLEQNRQYRFSFRTDFGPSANAALFRNPSASAYWTGRSGRALDILPDTPAYYTAPVSDWYGLVVYPIWNMSSTGNYQIHVERLDDCITLSPGVCVTNKIYTVATGPANDYTFTQTSPHWTAVAVLPDTLDEKALQIDGACDGDDFILQAPSPGVGKTPFIVGDFNHNPTGQYYARVGGWDTNLEYSIQWDDDPDIFPVPGEIMGSMSGFDPASVCVKVWDIYLEAGKQYEFFFYQWGQKAPHLALFRNPGTGTYWVGRGGSEWEMSAGYGFQTYTPPATDWYGLVVFADRRKEHYSLYQIQVQPLNDCEPLTSMVCESRTGWPRDFSFTRTTPYWAAVAVSASPGDGKGIGVFPLCDGKGGVLAYSGGDATRFVVADFNHTPYGTYYAEVMNNDNYAYYTVACDLENDTFPFDTVVQGRVGGTSGDCGLVRIWDVFLEAGATYQIGFTQSGAADIRLALFRNPGNGTYWAGRVQAVWEYSQSGDYRYTASANDWYGLVVFPNIRSKPGNYSIRFSNIAATGISTEPIVPKEFALYQNVPNPFNPTTAIRYDVPEGGGHVRLAIYDVNGRLVRTLVDRTDTPGEKSVDWDGTDDRGVGVSSGVYFCRLVAPGLTETRKMALIQ